MAFNFISKFIIWFSTYFMASFSPNNVMQSQFLVFWYSFCLAVMVYFIFIPHMVYSVRFKSSVHLEFIFWKVCFKCFANYLHTIFFQTLSIISNNFCIPKFLYIRGSISWLLVPFIYLFFLQCCMFKLPWSYISVSGMTHFWCYHEQDMPFFSLIFYLAIISVENQLHFISFDQIWLSFKPFLLVLLALLLIIFGHFFFN